MGIELLKSLGVVFLQPDLLPHILWRVCSLNSLHVQVASAFLLPDGCVAAVGKGAATAVAQTTHIILVPTEILGGCFRLEATVMMIDDLQEL
jgi:hypothetical protein